MSHNHNHGRRDKEENRINNVILTQIPDREFRLIKPHLQHVTFAVSQNLEEPGKGIDSFYFINSGLVSLVVGMKSGKGVEVGIAGYEGMTGLALTAGIQHTTYWTVTEVAGEGFRIKASVLEKLLDSAPQLQAEANRFVAVQAMQLAQTSACNRLHTLEQRMARWLLMTDDRVQQKTLSVTHDFLSMMLGTDRPSITASAQSFQERGAIKYSRGKLAILNRKKLEAAACECYAALKQFNPELGLN
jgi:CRP-like cAMP-binding protein